MSEDLGKLRTDFEAVFARPAAGAVRAPGRVNLIGEHTDYNDRFVLPIAIDRQTVALYATRDDRIISFHSRQADAPGSIDLTQPITPGEPPWANYCKGVAAGLIAAGVKLVGCDVMFDSNVPLGGGLSSSAALEVAAALAMLAAAGRLGAIPDQELALICQKAENEFAGAPCGIMDQSVAIMAKAGKALLLDCRSGKTRHVPFDSPDVVLLVADTQVKHDIGGAGYPLRRRQSHAAAEKLAVRALRDVAERRLADAAAAGILAGKELMRARHVVSEIARTLQAVEALEAGDIMLFGELMYASHESLRDDYEVSCEELDAIVELAERCDGVYGARMTGGGFGGCAIILADARNAQAIGESIAAGFAERFGRRCPIFPTRPCAGAGTIRL